MVWAPSYVTTPELAAYLRIGDTVDDAELALAISAASRAVDRHTNRQFGRDDAPVQRYYTARYDRERGRWVVGVDDLAAAPTEVAADNDEDDTYESVITSIMLEPRNAPANGQVYTRLVIGRDSAAFPLALPGRTRVTAQFGWPTVPQPVKQATLLQAARLFTRRDAPFGVAGSPDSGSEMRLLAKVDPDVAVSLGPYIRQWGVAV